MKLRVKLTLDIDVPVNWKKEDFEEFTINKLEEEYGEEFIECDSYFVDEVEKKTTEQYLKLKIN